MSSRSSGCMTLIPSRQPMSDASQTAGTNTLRPIQPTNRLVSCQCIACNWPISYAPAQMMWSCKPINRRCNSSINTEIQVAINSPPCPAVPHHPRKLRTHQIRVAYGDRGPRRQTQSDRLIIQIHAILDIDIFFQLSLSFFR